MQHLAMVELEAGLDEIRRSPPDAGTVELIVARPAVDERVLLDVAELDLDVGLVGDTWKPRGNRRTPDGSADPLAQVTLMNARVAALLAQNDSRRALAGDQLYVDFDLSEANVPAGTSLALGTAVLEVTEKPHTGCAKFRERYGYDAFKFVNSELGKALHLRGINTRVVVPGTVRRGDEIRKV